eukprot:CAMPEP_0185847092 /NCGR_PEP_ID=MMETSP1354-20130828/2493_1 /TAXON_ID=708628 /ORGANISM="Erythrolobus madagascarensis, Strain CCMP3276" /LENGTH=490 /DNA_ID=CAMNT_0028547341 /DNA_START=21 /DNA_END=1496 /DNA_ORIENTATION=-
MPARDVCEREARALLARVFGDDVLRAWLLDFPADERARLERNGARAEHALPALITYPRAISAAMVYTEGPRQDSSFPASKDSLPDTHAELMFIPCHSLRSGWDLSSTVFLKDCVPPSLGLPDHVRFVRMRAVQHQKKLQRVGVSWLSNGMICLEVFFKFESHRVHFIEICEHDIDSYQDPVLGRNAGMNRKQGVLLVQLHACQTCLDASDFCRCANALRMQVEPLISPPSPSLESVSGGTHSSFSDEKNEKSLTMSSGWDSHVEQVMAFTRGFPASRWAMRVWTFEEYTKQKLVMDLPSKILENSVEFRGTVREKSIQFAVAAACNAMQRLPLHNVFVSQARISAADEAMATCIQTSEQISRDKNARQTVSGSSAGSDWSSRGRSRGSLSEQRKYDSGIDKNVTERRGVRRGVEKKKARALPKYNKTCPHCSRVFSQTQHLRDHIRAIHERSKPFKCEQCHQSYSTASNLRQHSRLVHAHGDPLDAALKL